MRENGDQSEKNEEIKNTAKKWNKTKRKVNQKGTGDVTKNVIQRNMLDNRINIYTMREQQMRTTTDLKYRDPRPNIHTDF